MEGDVAPSHIRRLQQLELIEWSTGNWRLTAVGSRRYDSLAYADRQDKHGGQRRVHHDDRPAPASPTWN